MNNDQGPDFVSSNKNMCAKNKKDEYLFIYLTLLCSKNVVICCIL